MRRKTGSTLWITLFVFSVALLLVTGCKGDHQQARSNWLERPEPSAAQLKVLDRLRGTWEVEVVSSKPTAGTVTYRETYDWVLDGKYLRGETTRKSDGVQDIYMTTYDPLTKTYRFWLFNSKGAMVEFPIGNWDADTETMTWSLNPNWDINFIGHWTFPDAHTRKWTGRTTNWKGEVLIELEGTARRLAVSAK